MTKINIYAAALKKEIKYYAIFSVLAFISPLVALFIPYMPENESIFTWFQRSGSAMVVFGLLAEAKAINCFFILNPAGFAETGINEARAKYLKYPANLNIFSFLIIALGTLIWGYGDIWIKNA
ncbi:hypothetical protein EH243_01925 [Amphritea opalescens]|uniref:Uncharacterized protein n=1 Tax=Amphritea opalescens TaxID=2490544 RepID=A0A430KW52_9GAMM|nr:hypothetical protein [Amphritea opalescens]RTE67731.1 hypothetical protein EH243_01925 [Amphritea opalescens]